MRFELPEPARDVRAGVRDVLATACPPDTVRAAWPGGDRPRVDALWRALAELGVPALLVPELDGGLGLDELALVAAMLEAGYAGVPGPLLETVVAAPVLPPGLRERVLAGTSRVAVQRARLVPHAATSDAVLQIDRRPVRLLQAACVEPAPTTDGSRAAALVDGEGDPVEVSDGQVELLTHRATAAAAAYLVGLARRMLALTVSYVQTRHQFGVPVGSFQAVQHPLADALVAVELAEPVVLAAAADLSTRAPYATRTVGTAKALASDAATRTARTALQAHGAMGYTVEYDLHLFAKRAWAVAADWGLAAEHREALAGALLEGAQA